MQLQKLQAADEIEQRANILDKPVALMELLHVLFSIVQNVTSDSKLTFFVLALIDGILEDQRSRAEHYSTLMSTHRKFKTDCIGILMHFLQSSSSDEEIKRQSREMAANALSLIICYHEYEACQKHAKDFMNWLMHEDSQGNSYVRDRCRTACLLHLCKANEMAKIFVEERRGFNLIVNLLQKACTKND